MADVYTARITYAGPHRLDVTAKSGRGLGALLAPSWGILSPILALRKRGDLAGVEAAWPRYVELFTREMRECYREHRAAWSELRSETRVLVCYCTDPERCHRRVLAQILARVGMADRGELADGETPRQIGLAL